MSNPYQPPQADDRPPSDGAPAVARRVAASVIDATPTLLACWLVTTPVLLVAQALAVERRLGAGFFDPSAGGDPMLKLLPDHQRVSLGVALWLALQLLAVALRGRSIGKWICGLRIESRAGKASPARALLREVPRGGLAGALLLTGILGPRWLHADPATAYLPYALSSGQGPHPAAVALTIATLAVLLLAHLVADAILLTAAVPPRSFADRIGGTVVRTTATPPG